MRKSAGPFDAGREVHVTLPMPLRPYQLEAWNQIKRFSVLVWHRRAGKTVFAIKRLVIAALHRRQRAARYAYIAPLLKQARAVAWDYMRMFVRDIPGTQVNETNLEVTLPNGSRIKLYGADDPDALRGVYLDGVVLDEVAQMRPRLWGEIVRPALADREGWALFIGTPQGINLFSELFYAAQQDEDWYAKLLTVDDTKAIPTEELEQARKTMSEAQFLQEFYCDFHAAVENALIPMALVLEAQRRHLAAPSYDWAAKILGVDVARYGGDRSVIFRRQGLVAFAPTIFEGEGALNTMELASAVAREIHEFEPVMTFIDIGGLGVGVYDRLLQLGYRVTGVDFGGKPALAQFDNKRGEMWWELKEWLEAGGVLPKGSELINDLCAPLYSFANKRGKRELESKDAMRKRGLRSPDLGDALALTFAFPVAPEDAATVAGARRRRETRHEYDPLGGA